jgi:hypothetical protein
MGSVFAAKNASHGTILLPVVDDQDIIIIKIVQSNLILYSYLTKLSDNDFVEY